MTWPARTHLTATTAHLPEGTRVTICGWVDRYRCRPPALPVSHECVPGPPVVKRHQRAQYVKSVRGCREVRSGGTRRAWLSSVLRKVPPPRPGGTDAAP